MLIFRKGRKWEEEASVCGEEVVVGATEQTRGRRYGKQRINGRME